MQASRRLGLMGLLLAAGLAALNLADGRAEDLAVPKKIKIGMVGTLFRDVPDSLIETMSKPFGILMATQTGMVGELSKTGDSTDLGQKLTDGAVQLGIFHGFEYAWAREKFPQLRPLVIAINQSPTLHAYLVVKSNSTIAGFADLKEKTLDIPKGTRGHCRLYLEARCQECGQCSAENLLGKIICSGSAEEALDEIIDGTNGVAATIVDNTTLDSYKRRKPGRFGEIKVVAESEPFPAGVVVYKEGTIDEKTLTKFRDGLLNTHKSILGRQLLTLWKLTGFQAIPTEYDQMLSEIMKAYPPPPEAEEPEQPEEKE